MLRDLLSSHQGEPEIHKEPHSTGALRSTRKADIFCTEMGWRYEILIYFNIVLLLAQNVQMDNMARTYSPHSFQCFICHAPRWLGYIQINFGVSSHLHKTVCTLCLGVYCFESLFSSMLSQLVFHQEPASINHQAAFAPPTLFTPSDVYKPQPITAQIFA